MKPEVIAHRGFSGIYPENTLLAFQKAVELGVDEIEFDIRMTKDDYPVIIHDETVDRTTQGKGKVGDLTLPRIKELDAGIRFGKQFTGLKIPTLQEALRVIPEKVELNLHIYQVYSFPHLEKIFAVLRQEKRNNFYLAISPSLMPLARKINPGVKICNMGSQRQPWEYIEETRRLACQRLQFFTPSYEVTAEMVKKAHSYGILVNVFFADTRENMWKYIGLGVDAILTNYPDMLISLLTEEK